MTGKVPIEEMIYEVERTRKPSGEKGPCLINTLHACMALCFLTLASKPRFS